MKILKPVLVLSVAALVTFGALSTNARAAERRGGYSARAGAGHQGQNRMHRAPRTQGFNRSGRGFSRGGRGFSRGGRSFYRGGRGFYRGGYGVRHLARHRGYYYLDDVGGGYGVRHLARHRGYYYLDDVGCQPTFSFFYDSYGNRIKLFGSTCF
jgi:hypothetical protein